MISKSNKRLEHYRELKAKLEPEFRFFSKDVVSSFIDAEALLGNGHTFNETNPIAKHSPSNSACTVARATDVSINANDDCNYCNSDSDVLKNQAYKHSKLILKQFNLSVQPIQ